MIKLLILADDFTGGLDTGVQFANKGIPTRVMTNPDADCAAAGDACEVLVLVAETRHMTPEKAYDVVFRVVERAAAQGIPYIYKKTDSALRGNIGAELTAAMRASGAKVLPFLPALPSNRRVTCGGVHYVDGVPVSESPFGRDPFEPVRESNVAKLMRLQTDAPIANADAGHLPESEGLWVFDAETDDDLIQAGQKLFERGLLRVSAGCAGFAAHLPTLLGLNTSSVSAKALTPSPKGEGLPHPSFVSQMPPSPKGEGLPHPSFASQMPPSPKGEGLPHPSFASQMPPSPKGEGLLGDGLFVLCGSVNPITQRQLKWAEAHGFERKHISPEQKLDADYFQTEAGRAALDGWRSDSESLPWMILDANDTEDTNAESKAYAAARGMTTEDVRQRISGALGRILPHILSGHGNRTLLITGGDTLLQCMNRMGVYQMEPMLEVFPGVVLSRFEYGGETRYVITKSGGFGRETLLTDLKAMLNDR